MIKYLNKMLYTEEYLASQFTFGFELEGWVKNLRAFNEFQNFANNYFKDIPGKIKTLDDPWREEMSVAGDTEECDSCNGTGFYKICNNCEGKGCEECDFTGGEICEECEGIGFKRIRNEEYVFEWGSPIFNLTMENIKLILNFLDKAFELSFETNITCSTHVHIGFPDKTQIDKDMFWVLLNIINEDDEETIKNVSKFKKFNFVNISYASIDYIKRAKYILMNEGSDGLLDVINFIYNNNKYRILRIHPQGTLEWRGPRNYMNSQNRQIIREFFLTKLYPFIKKISKFLDTTEITIKGKIISKKEIYEMLDTKTSPVIKKVDNVSRKFVSRILSNPNASRYISILYRKYKWLIRNNIQDVNFDIEKLINNNEFVITEGSFLKTDETNNIINNVTIDGEVVFENFNLKNCKFNRGVFNFCSIAPETDEVSLGIVEFNRCMVIANKIIGTSQSDTYGNFIGGNIRASLLKNVTLAQGVEISNNTLIDGCALHQLNVNNVKIINSRIYHNVSITNSVVESSDFKNKTLSSSFLVENSKILNLTLVVTHTMTNNKFENCKIKFSNNSSVAKVFSNTFINCYYWDYINDEYVNSKGLHPKDFYENLVKETFNLTNLISIKHNESIVDYFNRAEQYRN